MTARDAYNIRIMPIYSIDSRQRSALRSAAHNLKPVVLLGAQGLTEAVLVEISRHLDAHGLIKIKAGGEDRLARDDLMLQICDQLGAAPVHHLGKIFIIFRPTESDPDGEALIARAQGLEVKVTRKPKEEFIPKKLAASGATASQARRRKTEQQIKQRTQASASVREQYLGRSSDRPPRPSTRDATPSGRSSRASETRRDIPSDRAGRSGPRSSESPAQARPAREPADATSREPRYERFGVRRPRAGEPERTPNAGRAPNNRPETHRTERPNRDEPSVKSARSGSAADRPRRSGSAARSGSAMSLSRTRRGGTRA